VRLDRAPPRRPVVAAAGRVEVDGIALRRERVREDGVVAVVLLVECARDRRRHRPLALAGIQHRADEAVDAPEPREARLLRVGAPAEEAAGLEEEPGEGTRLEAVGVEERESAEARAEPDAAAPPAAGEVVERLEERAGVDRRRGIGLEPLVRDDEREPVRGNLAFRCEAAQDAEQGRAAHVLGAVEDDEERPPGSRWGTDSAETDVDVHNRILPLRAETYRVDMATLSTGGANQAPPLAGHDLFSANRPLAESLEREGAGWAAGQCSAFGRLLGGAPLEWGRLANEHPPQLRTHDRVGERIDEVEFHPAWHDLMRLSVGEGLHSLSWTDGREGAHVARAALFSLASQVEAGHGCPISMTHAAVPALRASSPALAAEWEPLLTSRDYDFGLRPVAEKRGALVGMTMTERQGGSDLRTNTTVARTTGDGDYILDGQKWFCSAPMCDAFLVLAQAPGGLSCFLLPRVLPDGSRNGFRIERLKDKLGDRSNASSEIALEGAWAQLVGEEGRGVRTIVEMVVHTRLDCVLGSTAGMRLAVEHATHHTAHRVAFGATLAEQPLMRNVLADLCIESEAATVTAFRLARAYDRRADDPAEEAFARLATAVAKYWICKRGPGHAAEALECLGGNGFVEESGLPRLYRQQPLLSIWEGSGNVVCLDALRAIRREPESAEALLAEIRLAGVPSVTALAEKALGAVEEGQARAVVESLALALQASLLVRHAPAAVSDAFIASRLGRRALAYGALGGEGDLASIVERHRPIGELNI